MGEEVIGQCSICGGDVMQYTGPFFGTPPPAHCRSCGAVKKKHPTVIEMEPPKQSELQMEFERQFQTANGQLLYTVKGGR